MGKINSLAADLALHREVETDIQIADALVFVGVYNSIAQWLERFDEGNQDDACGEVHGVVVAVDQSVAAAVHAQIIVVGKDAGRGKGIRDQIVAGQVNVYGVDI